MSHSFKCCHCLCSIRQQPVALLKAIASDVLFHSVVPDPARGFVCSACKHTHTHTPALHHHFTHDGAQPVNSPCGAVLSVAIIGDCHP